MHLQMLSKSHSDPMAEMSSLIVDMDQSKSQKMELQWPRPFNFQIGLQIWELV